MHPTDCLLGLATIVALLLVTVPTTTEAVRCKCTKESETVSCTDGVCETDVGSCLMLDHPTMGVHYTCHTRGLKDGNCHNRTSKSGVSVKICGCNAPDFCNFSMWPDKAAHHHHKHHHKHHDEEQQDSVNSAPCSVTTVCSLLFSAVLYRLAL